jgi:hypothetical protein
MTEQDALNRSIAMAANAQAAVPGVSLDQSAPTALASKTKRLCLKLNSKTKSRSAEKCCCRSVGSDLW